MPRNKASKPTKFMSIKDVNAAVQLNASRNGKRKRGAESSPPQAHRASMKTVKAHNAPQHVVKESTKTILATHVLLNPAERQRDWQMQPCAKK